jgi:hypothetical protein
VTLPSGIWRLGFVVGLSMGATTEAGVPMDVVGWENLYVIGLSLVAEATAQLTLGLVRPWGERAPAWMPLIGGRRVPARPVVAVAGTGALALVWIWTFAFTSYASGGFEGQFSSTAWEALFIACYAPLILWGPLVGAVTLAYWHRRRGS